MFLLDLQADEGSENWPTHVWKSDRVVGSGQNKNAITWCVIWKVCVCGDCRIFLRLNYWSPPPLRKYTIYTRGWGVPSFWGSPCKWVNGRCVGSTDPQLAANKKAPFDRYHCLYSDRALDKRRWQWTCPAVLDIIKSYEAVTGSSVQGTRCGHGPTVGRTYQQLYEGGLEGEGGVRL